MKHILNAPVYQPEVRGYTESWCKGDAVQFFHAVGFSPQFEHLRQGLQYQVEENGVPLLVVVVQVCKLSEEFNIETATPMSADHWVVEVSATASSDTYPTASAAIGAFSDQPAVASLVKMVKPDIPVGRPTCAIRPLVMRETGSSK